MSSDRAVYLDFEFNQVLNEKVNLVSCVILHKGITKKYWLHNTPSAIAELKEHILSLSKNPFVCYSAVAEARSFYSMGIDPTKFYWIDLFLEYRCLTNHNDELCYGKQLVDGKVKMTQKPPPKWERTEEDESSGFSPTHSLAEATYKLTGKIRDTKEKEETRNLIISDPPEFTKEQQEQILEYNASDVEFLPELWQAMKEKYHGLGVDDDEIISNALLKGRFASLTAIMESKGYPIDYNATRNFSDQVSNIMLEVQQEINSLFPDINPFRWEKKSQSYVFDNKVVRKWLEKNVDVSDWKKTDTGQLSLSLDAFTDVFDYRHEYPKDNFGAQMVRYLKLKQSLYGFTQVKNGKSSRKKFWDFVGPDKRVRPYLNIYKAQSSRSQPSANGFMFLKPAWMRSLVVPAEGMAMAGVDFASQEFFLSALMSEDQTMIDAYLSGDVYLAFGKSIGIIPEDGDKKSHGAERDLCKSVVLGISYLMSKYGLAVKLTQDTGKPFTEDEAQELIDLFYQTYSTFHGWQQDLIEQYKVDGYIRLYDGWYMWGDNDNFRSVANVPIQGMAAAIMREAVHLAMNREKLYVPFTLHDALYIEYEVGQEEQINSLIRAMRDAFMDPFEGQIRKYASQIRLDPHAWSPNYQGEYIVLKNGLKVNTQSIYVDSRGKKEYEQFKKYFEVPDSKIL
jgi:hypothetical protein